MTEHQQCRCTGLAVTTTHQREGLTEMGSIPLPNPSQKRQQRQLHHCNDGKWVPGHTPLLGREEVSPHPLLQALTALGYQGPPSGRGMWKD